MRLTPEERAMLAGKEGRAAKKSMEILCALGEIFGAKRLVPVRSVQVAGVSYHNLGEAGLEFLSEMAEDGRVRVLTTLNPAGMDLENWEALGIDPGFARRQKRVIEAFSRMGVVPTCTCTPYLAGNRPGPGDHVAWSESSAVAFANSVIGARTNREGGPSALAAAVAGRTGEYGLHLSENRRPTVRVLVEAALGDETDWSALGHAIGSRASGEVPYIEVAPGGATGPGPAATPSLEALKTFSASIATYGGTALYHLAGVTPETHAPPETAIALTGDDLARSRAFLSDDGGGDPVDFVSVGCPHCSIDEIRRLAVLLDGRRVRRPFWICTARAVAEEARRLGLAQSIEAAGAVFACDTCLAVAPLRDRFRSIATDSAKGCYYGRGNNGFKTRFRTLEECVEEATR